MEGELKKRLSSWDVAEWKDIEKILDEVNNDFYDLFNKLFLGKISYEESTRQLTLKIQKWFGTVARKKS